MVRPGEPIAGVLRRLDAELAVVADQLRDVEQALAQLVRRAPAIEAELFADLQQLDHALQSLLVLQSFTSGLAALAGQDWLIDVRGAVGQLNLAAVAARLGGSGDRHGIASNGEIELF